MLFPNKKRAQLRQHSLKQLYLNPHYFPSACPDLPTQPPTLSPSSQHFQRLLERPKYPTASTSKVFQKWVRREETGMVLRLSGSVKRLKKVSKLRVREEEWAEGKHGKQNNQNRQQEWVLDRRYRVGEQIGKGSYGVVHKAVDTAWGNTVAIKQFLRGSLQQQRFHTKLTRQVSIHSRLNHPNIAKFHRLVSYNGRSFMVMEYCHGINLKEYLKRNKELTEETVRRIFRGIVAAVEYCHGQKVAHRDIKLENIIIDEEKMEVKVIDFGFSSTLGHPDQILRSYCGTPLYMAPQITLKKPYNPIRSDLWALGVLLVVLSTGKHPFLSKQQHSLFTLIQKGEPTFSRPVSDELKALAKSLLQKNQLQRISMADILQSDWLK